MIEDTATAHHDIPFQEYRSWEGLSQSGLRHLARSPGHYQHYLRNPMASTPAMRFGSIVDCLVLEPDDFEQRYLVAPEMDRRTREWKAWRDDHPAADREIITQDEYARALSCRAAIMLHDEAGRLVSESDHQVSWRGTIDGAAVKGRADMVAQSGWWVADLKTTQDCSEHAFGRSAAAYKYFHQAWMYSRLHELATVHEECTTEWYWVVVESEPPHGVAVYRASVAGLMEAGQDVRRLLRLYHACTKVGQWPTSMPGSKPLDLRWI